MKRTDKTIKLIARILEDIEKGVRIDMPSEKAAINFRQRVYNYRNAMIKKNSDPDSLKKLTQLRIAVDGKIIHFSLSAPDYLEDIDYGD